MHRRALVIAVAIATGIAAVYLLPALWIGPLSAVAAVLAFAFAVIVRVGTKTEPPANAVAGVLLSVLNLPEQPLAEVKQGWALTTFLALAAFLVSLALSVMVRAHA